MKAVLLVGGEGTRLRPLTLTTPKPMLPVAGMAFVDRQLAWLAHHGISEVVLALGYRSETFLDHFAASGTDFDGPIPTSTVPVRIVVEDEPLGTAGAIRFAADRAGVHERFLVCNGDVLTTLDLGALVAFHDERGAEASIHLTQVEDPSAFGVVVTGPDGKVEAFVEKPPPGEAPSDWVNAGTYVFEPSMLGRIPVGRAVSVERETFPSLLGQGGASGGLFALGTDDYWLDMGTPDKYRQANHDVAAGRLRMPPLAEAVERAPGVWFQPGVSVADDVIFEAPVLVERGSTIGSGVRVARSTIGSGCTVGDRTSISDSVLLAGVHVAAGVELCGSIVGADARVDAASGAIRDEILVADVGSNPAA